MNTTAETKDRITEHLSKTELARIHKMILGYGNFKRTLQRTALPESTFRDIIYKGYGYPENIKRIRESLFSE
jgi:hypothetical protein